ncbi:hypothetical protein J2Z53_000200 [Clostridium moniliforme]|uniref:Apea-like HEPN domain-containing protein n=1 Tax=Clostridium moniliforme TaxID=39489 RepID=A0ABS4EXA1_9CLOT|nr:hypothetical protein [Clostridium moniliforme]MBP1888621.1 hypothetical protein [Clostridium moniliforme]
MGERKILKENFEPKDNKEREYFIKQVKDILDMFLIDYRDFITLIYGELESYIDKYIKDKNRYKVFEKNHNKKSKLYNKVQYLIEIQGIYLMDEEKKIFKFINTKIRPKRNSLAHEGLPFNKEIDAEEILNSGQITSILKTIELEHKDNKDIVLFIVKEFLNIIDNKFVYGKSHSIQLRRVLL